MLIVSFLRKRSRADYCVAGERGSRASGQFDATPTDSITVIASGMTRADLGHEAARRVNVLKGPGADAADER